MRGREAVEQEQRRAARRPQLRVNCSTHSPTRASGSAWTPDSTQSRVVFCAASPDQSRARLQGGLRDGDERSRRACHGEFELDLSLIASMGLPQHTADDLAAEVHEAMASLSRSE